MRCLLISIRFLLSIRKKLLHAAYNCDAFFRGCTPVERQKCRVLIFSIFGQTLPKMIKTEILHCCKKTISDFLGDKRSRTNNQSSGFQQCVVFAQSRKILLKYVEKCKFYSEFESSNKLKFSIF